jgi:hypothetical protein
VGGKTDQKDDGEDDSAIAFLFKVQGNLMFIVANPPNPDPGGGESTNVRNMSMETRAVLGEAVVHALASLCGVDEDTVVVPRMTLAGVNPLPAATAAAAAAGGSGGSGGSGGGPSDDPCTFEDAGCYLMVQFTVLAQDEMVASHLERLLRQLLQHSGGGSGGGSTSASMPPSDLLIKHIMLNTDSATFTRELSGLALVTTIISPATEVNGMYVKRYIYIFSVAKYLH